ncbi:ATP-binding cassette domain-containing protein [Comamonas aquatica]|uniref:ATP-binding cassette domain-containing protein n=1 Tax=Comamonas aquatica TaxID=225991 RepID=A0AA42W5N1_9BURK|nr:ATP-binding cassette domain-containing protein [Comamonas aquatica]MDH0363776.1 ATP-binding cassette domain-containing protein [Comamonas aquatica]MDH0370512.1 ATP-binding cassette domain-containing protein [Comamonas aquatica]MDH0382318.1 ATP-binding cassette domain-containing protein [Comamonas aquatica]MDH0428725.1 ATP-binding cassette domain-containing protein [Comamonas aquatica]MDH0493738.1 ATP-binding cassette domain-containing protein [Comamonas aquatica]
MIETRKVVKVHGTTTVLHGVDVQIPAGQLTAIIGPNGAGKSTLLALVSRLAPITSGTASVAGLDVGKTASDALAKVMAILRQDNQSALRLTVRDLVGFGRFPHSKGRMTSEDLRHVDEALAFLQLEPLADRFLDELSGGQRQRAYIAMVLCQDTPYILLDEPLNNLDMAHAVSMMRLLRRMVDERGKTVVVVLHDINFASCYADHILAMKDGRVAYEGSPLQVVQDAVLSSLYGLEVSVHEVKGQRLCHYFA